MFQFRIVRIDLKGFAQMLEKRWQIFLEVPIFGMKESADDQVGFRPGKGDIEEAFQLGVLLPSGCVVLEQLVDVPDLLLLSFFTRQNHLIKKVRKGVRIIGWGAVPATEDCTPGIGDDDDRELEAFGLVHRHDLDTLFRFLDQIHLIWAFILPKPIPKIIEEFAESSSLLLELLGKSIEQLIVFDIRVVIGVLDVVVGIAAFMPQHEYEALKTLDGGSFFQTLEEALHAHHFLFVDLGKGVDDGEEFLALKELDQGVVVDETER
ncbi:MAG: hypothetical protein BWY50_00916 [Spirochaetes bacterium ADurb.Bin315]|nr:MAG: hypothetical protein BWY50_00916 [Spirochaetes bacterium ADurb.Bin315]